MDTTTSTETKDGKYWMRLALAWAMSLLVIFILFYVASKAWKKGQQA